MGKLLQSILTKHIANHLESNNLIKVSQHGFRSDKFCLTNLLDFLHDMFLYHDNCSAVGILYLYIEKASDTVPHKRLMVKVIALTSQNQGTVAGWIENWI